VEHHLKQMFYVFYDIILIDFHVRLWNLKNSFDDFFCDGFSR